MGEYFSVRFLKEVDDFLIDLDKQTKKKILYNIDRARFTLDPKLFKKLTDEIWEFRTKYRTTQYRLLAFWDKTDNKETLVICTHGIVKKTSKTPKNEIARALNIRKRYFETK